jgi:hypothetical protein
MNWYYEDNGVAQGPLLESQLEAHARSQKIVADTLIWQAGSSEWKSVKELRPVWLEVPKQTADPVVAVKAEAKPKPLSKQATARAKDTPLAKGTSNAEHPKTAEVVKPIAVVEEPVVEKPGILKRLFGLGRKK